MSKHTPGPWSLEHCINSADPFYWEVEGQDDSHVASNPFGGNTPETEMANARLIVKSPELLEMCEKLADLVCDTCRLPRSPKACAGCFADEAQRLIERIEG